MSVPGLVNVVGMFGPAVMTAMLHWKRTIIREADRSLVNTVFTKLPVFPFANGRNGADSVPLATETT